jgi:hypothetical protein
MVNAARPPILKAADFSCVSPNNLVVTVTEKRRVKIHEVYALRLHTFEYFKIIA